MTLPQVLDALRSWKKLEISPKAPKCWLGPRATYDQVHAIYRQRSMRSMAKWPRL